MENINKTKSFWVSGDYSIWLIEIKEGPINLNLRKEEYLDMIFYGGEWGQLFYGVLGCPFADEYLPEEDIKDWIKRNEDDFRKSIPNYPMLSELYDTYNKILFNQIQIKQLLKEVLDIIPIARNDKIALNGLKTLRIACEKAIEKDKLLYLSG